MCVRACVRACVRQKAHTSAHHATVYAPGASFLQAPVSLHQHTGQLRQPHFCLQDRLLGGDISLDVAQKQVLYRRSFPVADGARLAGTAQCSYAGGLALAAPVLASALSTVQLPHILARLSLCTEQSR